VAADYDDIDAIRIRALRGVWKPDYESALRRIFRWYSERFHTPLHTVPDLPLDDILLNFFEVQYESMEPQEWHNAAINLLETPDERRQRRMNETKADEDFLKKAASMVEKKKVNKQLRKKAAELAAALAKAKEKPAEEKPAPKPEPEEVAISFSEGGFDDDFDPMGVPPPKPRQ
jgi:hypothetical protein